MENSITRKKAEKCTTHHYACDCREYKFQQIESALKVIFIWANFYKTHPDITEMTFSNLNKALQDIATKTEEVLMSVGFIK